MAFGRRKSGSGAGLFGPGPKPEKETIAQRVAKHNKPGKARDEDLNGSGDEPKGDNVSNTTVGNLFDFSAYERAAIQVIVTEYDKKVKATIRNAKEIDFSTVDLSNIRSRCAIILDVVNKATKEKPITLQHPHRQTLGAACSLYMRWCRKEKDTLTNRLIDKKDIEKAMETTQHIANKIGEQLTLYIDDEDKDE